MERHRDAETQGWKDRGMKGCRGPEAQRHNNRGMEGRGDGRTEGNNDVGTQGWKEKGHRNGGTHRGRGGLKDSGTCNTRGGSRRGAGTGGAHVEGRGDGEVLKASLLPGSSQPSPPSTTRNLCASGAQGRTEGHVASTPGHQQGPQECKPEHLVGSPAADMHSLPAQMGKWCSMGQCYSRKWSCGVLQPQKRWGKGEGEGKMVGVTTSMGFEVLIRIVPMSMVMNIDMMNLMLGWLRKQSRLILEMYSPLSQGSWRGDTAGSLGVSPRPMGCRRGPTSNPSAVAAART